MKNERGEKVVLFLGAGFSADAGHPTMNGFGAASKNELDNQRSQWKDRSYSVAREVFTGAGKIFFKFQDYCRKANNFTYVDTDNIEDIMAIAEILSISRQENLAHVDNLNPLKIKREIDIWLWKIYHRLPTVDHPDLLYKEFMVDIIEPIRDRLTILTTNYDLTFEYHAYHDANIRCRCPMRGEDYIPLQLPDDEEILENNYKPLPLSGDKEIYVAAKDSKDSGKSAPLICKLHGSVNYFEKDGENPPLCVLCEWDPTRSKYARGRPTVAWVRPVAEFIKKSGYVPAIIPPTYSKLEEKEWVRRTFEEAYKALVSASAIIFIGYSFPDSDGFMRAFIQSAMADPNRSPSLRVWVFDPDPAVHKRYRTTFCNIANLQLIRKKFKDGCIGGDIEEAINSSK